MLHRVRELTVVHVELAGGGGRGSDVTVPPRQLLLALRPSPRGRPPPSLTRATRAQMSGGTATVSSDTVSERSRDPQRTSRAQPLTSLIMAASWWLLEA